VATTEPAWPEQYPVETVETTIGMTLKNVDQAEYTDLRRQGLIKFDAPTEQAPAEAPAEQSPTTPHEEGK